MYAEVVVDRPIIKQSKIADTPPADEAWTDENRLALTFHYTVPPDLIDQIQVGQLVAVPFRTEQLQAIIVGLGDISPIDQTRPLAALLDTRPVVTPAQIALARWLSHEYLTPLATCLRYFLPPGSSYKSEFVLKPNTIHANAVNIPLNAPEQILLTYLRQKGQVRWSEVNLSAANGLLKRGLAHKVSVLTAPHVGPKIDRTVELLIPPTEIEAVLPTLGHASKRADVLLHLANSDDPLPNLTHVLAQVGCTESVVKSLADKGWVEILPKETRFDLTPTCRTDILSVLGGQARSLSYESMSPEGQKILAYLATQLQPTLLETIIEATGVPRSVLNTLLKKELVRRFEEPAQITLKLPPKELVETVVELRGAHSQAAVLKLLAREDGPLWIGWVYAQTDTDMAVLRDLAQANLITINESRRWRDPLADKVFTLDNPPELTPEQYTAWQKIIACLAEPKSKSQKPILLHGVTGSGKTEIYLQTIAAVLAAGKQALMLVPEITLATQAIARVSARFPGQVAIWHSALSPGERYDNWDKVRRGELSIVVGPRSALFAPLQNLGVIVVDEEHDPTYKHHDRAPLFHARDGAIQLGQLSGALVILGSASPDVATYRQAERGEYHLLNLPNRPIAHRDYMQFSTLNFGSKQQKSKLKLLTSKIEPKIEHSKIQTLPLPKVEIVDLREELKAGNRTIFSRALQAAMHETLQRGEQVILFLNRRGTATFVNCRDCGYVQHCPHCDTTLTYHAHGEKLICHYCGHRQPPDTICPMCHSSRIRYFGLGTERVEEMVKEMFPQATPVRWDQDSSRQAGGHDVFLQHFMSGQANVMIGTQMVTKGLDFPLVTLVGVISADTSVYLPDFRAVERTFQLLMQVAGRAGRSPLGGRVIIQTYHPELAVIKAAAQHDYLTFYKTELAFRREQQYPPFKRLAILLYSGAGEERSAAEAQQMVARLRLHIQRLGLPSVDLIGPTPHYVRRLRSQYRWYILVRANQPADVLRPLMPLPHGWRVNIDPVTLL